MQGQPQGIVEEAAVAYLKSSISRNMPKMTTTKNLSGLEPDLSWTQVRKVITTSNYKLARFEFKHLEQQLVTLL